MISTAPASSRYWRRSIRRDGSCSARAAFSAGMPKASQPIGCSTLKPARALIAGDDVAHRIIADVAHMDAAGRIGKHLEDVIFRPRSSLPVRKVPPSSQISAIWVRLRGRCSAVRPCYQILVHRSGGRLARFPARWRNSSGQRGNRANSLMLGVFRRKSAGTFSGTRPVQHYWPDGSMICEDAGEGGVAEENVQPQQSAVGRLAEIRGRIARRTGCWPWAGLGHARLRLQDLRG